MSNATNATNTTTNTNANTSTPPINERLIDRLRKVLALTHSPEEGEAMAAAEILAKLLTDHNLSIADLEKKGAHVAAVSESGYDLGKAAFRWKLDLAEVIAEHYFCHGLVDRYSKMVTFIGRPDNVESLKMLYSWIIEQVRRLSNDERKRYQLEFAEHVDPLRWQVNFGLGVVSRLGDRLEKLRNQQQQDASTTALVIHHATEISDFMEHKYGRRIDGRNTKALDKYYKDRAEQQKRDEELLARDPDAYYEKYPWLHPDRLEAERKAEEKRFKRRMNYQPRGRYRSYNPETERKEAQADSANNSGRKSADRINLQPFLGGRGSNGKGELD